MSNHIPDDLSIPPFLNRNPAGDDEAVPEISVEAYEKIDYWRDKLDQTAKLNKRAVYERATVDLFLEAEYERNLGAVQAITDAIYFLGRDHTGLNDDDIQYIMDGAKAKAERPINDRALRDAVDEPPSQYSEINPPPPQTNPGPQAAELEARDVGDDTEKPPPLPFINMSNWDNESVPEQEWAVPDRIPLGQTTLFTGEGGYGKSTVQLHLCAAHALGLSWLNTLPEPGPSVFFEAEDGERTIHRRLAAIATHYRVRFEDMIRGGLHIVSLFGRDAVLATPTRNGKVEPTRLYGQLLQVAGDIKPKMIGIASSANIFAGSENDRTQTQQFVGLLNRLAMTANGSVVLISHPSLTGINTDTGLSGSTQWHNAVRARFYLKAIKVEAGEQPDNDLRELVFKKNQFGPMSANIVLRYRNGLFLPEKGASGLDKLAREAKADETFRRSPQALCRRRPQRQAWPAVAATLTHHHCVKLMNADCNVLLDVTLFTVEDMRRFAGEAWGQFGIKVVERWCEYNATYFNGALRPVPLVITHTQPFGKRLAFCSYNINAAGRTITLNVPKAHKSLLADNDTLLHEMVHQFLFERGEYPSHDGEPWRREIMRSTRLVRKSNLWRSWSIGSGRVRTACSARRALFTYS
jgi:RecA-family ATPase